MSSLVFEAVSEKKPGPKWRARWDWSWPAYRTWFLGGGGSAGPSRAECEAALRHYMPELSEVHAALARCAGNGDLEARFLSTWCPPPYLGGCSLAAASNGRETRLVRNYDLSPDLNEGLLLRSEWRRSVMGMAEFLWGLSDGINDAGLSVALAYGGSRVTRKGFGITTIVRYLLETSGTVGEALDRLERVPSHMAYNLVLADRSGRVASVELGAGGGIRPRAVPVATNHQTESGAPERSDVTRTFERSHHLERLVLSRTEPSALREAFLADPLYQSGHAEGFGTLFTAEYDPLRSTLVLAWPSETWRQSLSAFTEGKRAICYELKTMTGRQPALRSAREYCEPDSAFDRLLNQAMKGTIDWASFGRALAHWPVSELQ